MTFRSLATAALAGAALLVPSAPANALLCGGVENCPFVALQLVLDTYGDVDERVDDIPPVIYIDYPDVIQQRCYYVDPSITRICLLP